MVFQTSNFFFFKNTKTNKDVEKVKRKKNIINIRCTMLLLHSVTFVIYGVDLKNIFILIFFMGGFC